MANFFLQYPSTGSASSTNPNPTRGVSADTTLTTSDRSLFVDTVAASGDVNVTLPAGVDGLEFYIKDSGGNAAAKNILFIPNGSDSIEVNTDITTDSGARLIQFFTDTWYVMSRG